MELMDECRKDITPVLNELRPGQNGEHFADNIFICIFMNENHNILIQISLKFILKGPYDNGSPLVQLMTFSRQAII